MLDMLAVWNRYLMDCTEQSNIVQVYMVAYR